jgi:DNA-binding beta-propeller fold protein YncE
MRGFMRLSVVLAAFAGGLGLSGCGASDKSTGDTAQAAETLEEALAEAAGEVAEVAGEGLKPVEGLPDAACVAPMNLAVGGGHLFVACSNYVYPAYGNSWLAVVDEATLEVVNRIPAAQKDATFVAVQGERVYLVETGEMSWNQDAFRTEVTSDGAVESIPLAQAATATAFDQTIAIPRDPANPLAGAPGAPAFDPTGRYLYLASGTSATLYKLDLEQGSLVNGPANPILLDATADVMDMVTLRPYQGSQLLVARLNTDALQVFDTAQDAAGAPIDLGKTDQMEGAQDLAFDPASGKVYAIMSISNAVAMVDLGQQPPLVDPSWAVTGTVPNRVQLRDGALYIVNSLENNVQRIDLASGDSVKPFATLPEGSNPWDLLFSADGARLYVSNNMAGTLAVIDASSVEVLKTLGAE